MSEPVAYLLGELDDAQVAEFERAMAADPALREEVERLRPVVTRLERVPHDAWEEVEPPPLMMPGDAAAPDAVPRHGGDPDGAVARRRRLAAVPRRLVLRPVVAALAAVALLAAGTGLGVLLDRDPAPSAELALRPVGDRDPGAGGEIAVSGDGLTVRVSGLRPTDGGEFYELWLLGADKRLVGLGSFQVGADGAAKLELPLPVDPGTFEFFDLSLEPGDGDPGHSGVSVLRGPTAA
jgi:anti-sigma-K factor RskA